MGIFAFADWQNVGISVVYQLTDLIIAYTEMKKT